MKNKNFIKVPFGVFVFYSAFDSIGLQGIHLVFGVLLMVFWTWIYFATDWK